MMQPGEEVIVSVSVRNAGSTVWTPSADYKLGAQNPRDNSIWGTNRVHIEPNRSVNPGEIYTFSWPVVAPQKPGVYNFQWSMLRELVHWFGQMTDNIEVTVEPSAATGAWATREKLSGVLKSQGAAVLRLRGGHYHLFQKKSRADKALSNGGAVIRPNYGENYPCAPDTSKGDPPLPSSALQTWLGVQQQIYWKDLFDSLKTNGINLVRVFLMNGFGISPTRPTETTQEVYPFLTQLIEVDDPQSTDPRKKIKVLRWKIKEAITDPGNRAKWNAAYFNRLRSFAAKARDNGVFLQLSLFNYYELNDAPWALSIWNPDRSLDKAWGEQNLVPRGGQGNRQLSFIAPPAGSGLRLVQREFVKKVVRELRGLPNIILEIMNEPHRGTHEESSSFSSEVVGWILSQGNQLMPKWQPLISVNASLRPLVQGDVCAQTQDIFDVDAWAAKRPVDPNYEAVDIISYHGLTGYNNECFDLACKCQHDPRCRQRTYPQVPFPPVDEGSIIRRFDAFVAKHPGKALMLSTDAVAVGRYVHQYGNNSMDLREGQITTGLANTGGTAREKKMRSDLENWAYWCFNVAKSKDSVIHFQNHSTYEAAYPLIARAYRSIFPQG